MNISAPFIARPVATTLLTLGIAFAGALGFSKLPVAPLPQVDYPTISVTSAIWPRWRSSGAVKLVATVIGLAPGSCALTEMVG